MNFLSNKNYTLAKNLRTTVLMCTTYTFIGNENSIAIVANDGIHFCKGTCKEESQMWLDILRLFPTATVLGQGRATGNGGRAKRSATFPGIRIMSPASRFANNKAIAMTNNKNEINNEEQNPSEDQEDDAELDESDQAKEVIKEKPPLTPHKGSILRKSSGSSRYAFK